MTASPIPTIRPPIPTDGQIWPEHIGISGQIKSASAIDYIGINGRFGSKYALLSHLLSLISEKNLKADLLHNG